MKHLVNWIEIPVKDMGKAIGFYSSILSIDISTMETGGMLYGFFPAEDQKNTGALVKGEFYEPSDKGIMIYLDGGSDLNLILNKVNSAGGMVLMEKTYISEEAGYAGIFLDSEGNKIGLQSYN